MISGLKILVFISMGGGRLLRYKRFFKHFISLKFPFKFTHFIFLALFLLTLDFLKANPVRLSENCAPFNSSDNYNDCLIGDLDLGSDFLSAIKWDNSLRQDVTINNIANVGVALGSVVTSTNSNFTINITFLDFSGVGFTNNGTIRNTGGGNALFFQYSKLDNIINNGTIETTNREIAGIRIGNDSTTAANTKKNNIINNGTITGGIDLVDGYTTVDTLNNSGSIGGGVYVGSGGSSRINNLINTGTIEIQAKEVSSGSGQFVHFQGIGHLSIQTYALNINEDASTFNAFGTAYTNGNLGNTSHLVIDGGGGNKFDIMLKPNAKILLSFSGDFQLNTNYLLSKLITIYNPGDSTNFTQLTYEDSTTSSTPVGDSIFTHLESTDPLYGITQNGTYFQVYLNEDVLEVVASANNIYRSNISLMNTFIHQSNQAIYTSSFRKYGFPYNRVASNDKTPESRGLKRSVASTTPQASFIRVNYNPSQREFYSYSKMRDSNNTSESSFYVSQNDTRNLRRRGFVGTKQPPQEAESNSTPQIVAPSRVEPQIAEPRAVESQTAEIVESQIDSTSISTAGIAPAQSKSYDSHFFFMPFFSNQQMSANDGLKSSGNTYGFITGLSGDFGSTMVGGHIGFGYGGYNNKVNLDYTQISTMLGLHLRTDFIYGLFLKARADGYYFYNTINPMNANQTKDNPTSIGFDAMASFGKQWNITSGAMKGIASIEAGLSYEGLSNSGYSFGSERYSSNMLNLFYGEIFGQYDKFFGDSNAWVLNMGLGVKYLLTGRPEVDVILNSNSYGVVIGTDKFYGIAQIGVDYRINENLALNLNYLGMFGDRSMTNSGFFNVRLWF
ncbi:hypothetical protein CCY99_07370 [Helicobacter sp. 16-1353]|uniref:hypothetical protein n=1 Tax=Helicobacter sp. 16-1353 TaxID=2004996 RepID=UPI000DCDFB98|nr:hypothetical protein [Helicobacter sp. 16-1353]RAX52458.1 hypothetical protein CCY99_07370 [Helicobacter sp. 16-1353]